MESLKKFTETFEKFNCFKEENDVQKVTMRWYPFLFIAEELLKKNKPLNIMETGCTRRDTKENWTLDGNATLIWDYLINKTGGEGNSVDIDPKAVEQARVLVTKMKIHEGDSVTFLRNNLETVKKLDLIYLDSYDWNGPPSAMHHLAEFASVFEYLPSGCLIAIDDCHEPYFGKHFLVRIVLELFQIKPIYESYVMVWRKP